uniref:Uncharacterized protein n=1 Tax=Picea sitchensis TaxID=3332 RepID=D5A921_PICSI|nr:unknown [Picea sitchensis]
MKSPCFEHVYGEFNREADSLSKVGLQLVDGTGIWREIKDDNLIQETPILHPQMRIPLTAIFPMFRDDTVLCFYSITEECTFSIF